LPAPFGPRRPTTPGGIDTVTSFRAMTGPYQREARVKARGAAADVSVTAAGGAEVGDGGAGVPVALT
jgi:hypothetical protein